MARQKHAIPRELAEKESQTLDPNRTLHPTADVYQHGEKSDNAVYDPAEQYDENGNLIPLEKIVEQYLMEQLRTGRPSAYNRLFHPRLAYLILSKTGAEMNQLADIFGINPGTFANWRWKYPEFNAAIKAGWDEFAISTAERALLNRAVGFKSEDIKYARVPVYDTVMDNYGRPHKVISSYEEVIVERIQKTVAPDPTSLMFLLQNRHGERWRNVRKVEATHTVEHSTGNGQSSGVHHHAHLHLSPSQHVTTPAARLPEMTDDQLLQLRAAAISLGLLSAPAEQTDNRDAIDVTAEPDSPDQEQGTEGTGESSEEQ